MIFSDFKQSDNRRPARYTMEYLGPDGESYGQFVRTAGSPGSMGKQRVTLFNRTKDYRPGRFSINPFDARSCTGSESGSICYLHSKYAGKVFVSLILSGEIMASIASPSWDTVYPADLDQQAVDRTQIRAFGKMNAPDLELGTVVGELEQTLTSLRSPLKNVRTLMTSMVKGISPKKPSWYKQMCDAWLEYRYDVMPNVILAQDIVEYSKRKRPGYGLKRKTSMDGVTLSSTTTEGSSNVEGYTLYWTRTKKVSTSTCSRVFFRYEDVNLVLGDFGLGLVDVPAVAWELIPYSFVVDWFLGVGDWLKAHRSIGNRTILGVTHSTKLITSDKYAPKGFASLAVPGTIEPTMPSVYEHKTEKFIRVIGDSDLPTLPLVKPNFANMNRIIDSFALTRQYLPSILTRRP